MSSGYDTEQNHHDICYSILGVDSKSALAELIKFGLAFIFVFQVLYFLWRTKKYERLAHDGDSDAVPYVIFPLFVKVIWFNVFVNLYIAAVLIYAPSPNEYSFVHSLLPTSAIVLQHFFMEGIALLLMRKGMGYHSALKCIQISFLWAIVTGAVHLGALSLMNKGHLLGSFLLKMIWLSFLFIFYLAVWKAPRRHLFRRPAVIRYAAFCLFYVLIDMIDNTLLYFPPSFNVGACFQVFGVLLLYAILQPILTYRTLLRDSRWWQGFAIEGFDDFGVIGRYLNRSSSEEPARRSAAAITSPLQGLDLKLESAQNLAYTADQMATENIKLANFAYITLNEKKLLGQGSFSKVYKGTYHGKECAIKLIYTTDLTVETIKRISSEAEILTKMKNANIVGIYGVSVLPPSICILLELCQYGSLGDVLRGRESDVYGSTQLRSGNMNLSFADMMFLALGCARGIAAMHCFKGVCHRDIKSFNFLVDSQLNAKVADLELGVSLKAADNFYKNRRTGGGLYSKWLNELIYCWIKPNRPTSDMSMKAKMYNSFSSHHSQEITIELQEEAANVLPNWLAPEFITTGQYVQPSDVYSLGLVIWEILTRAIPFADQGGPAKIRQMITNGIRPPIPAHCNTELKELIETMWAKDYKSRPTAEDVVGVLESIWVSSCYGRVDTSEIVQVETKAKPRSARLDSESVSSRQNSVDIVVPSDEFNNSATEMTNRNVLKTMSSKTHSKVQVYFNRATSMPVIDSFDSNAKWLSAFDGEIWGVFDSFPPFNLLYCSREFTNELGFAPIDSGTDGIWSDLFFDDSDDDDVYKQFLYLLQSPNLIHCVMNLKNLRNDTFTTKRLSRTSSAQIEDRDIMCVTTPGRLYSVHGFPIQTNAVDRAPSMSFETSIRSSISNLMSPLLNSKFVNRSLSKASRWSEHMRSFSTVSNGSSFVTFVTFSHLHERLDLRERAPPPVYPSYESRPVSDIAMV